MAINFLKNSILSAMKEYAEYLSGSNLPKVSYSILNDEKTNKYQLLAIGWEGTERVYQIIFHADIINDHIWIQEDCSEEGLATLLLEKGVSKNNIVLAYYPEHHRQFTEFAVV